MAASGDDVRLLIDFGLINEDGVSRLAALIRGIQSLTGAGIPGAPGGARRRRGRPPRAQGAGAAAPAPGRRTRRKRGGRRTPFDASKEDLQKLRETMTVAKIADKYGVSRPTVFLRLKKFGLTTPRGSKRK